MKKMLKFILFFAMPVLFSCTPKTEALFIVNNKSCYKKTIPKGFDWSVESIGALLEINDERIYAIDVIKELENVNVDCILLMTVNDVN